jgi:DNA polymerase-3 subunit delta'
LQNRLSFDEIAGHDRPVTILKRALANKTLAHAYLFSGGEGIGKKMTALSLAAAVNCRNSGLSGGCGVCPSCRMISALSHPDVHILAADGDEIKIDQVRQTQADLALKPFEGAKKILIVDGAESMNPSSANAFLKTLEEPPGETLIVLISPLPQSLLPTIRSRCQEIRFLPLPRPILAQELMRKRGLSEENAWFLAALAQGSLGSGLAMDVEQEKAKREELMALWSGLAQMNEGDMLAQAEVFSKDRQRLERLIDIGVEWLRDALVFRVTGDERLLVHGQTKDRHLLWGEGVTLQRMLDDMALFTASSRLLERRISAQLVAENLLLKLAHG